MTRWTPDLAVQALEDMSEQERGLLLRIAEARGVRVPLKALARDLGLPPVAALDQDFPQLTAFCAKCGAPARPVTCGGTADDAWYWMHPIQATQFQRALTPPAP
jgi:hypothetical protein